jgi:hypothetical protein
MMIDAGEAQILERACAHHLEDALMGDRRVDLAARDAVDQRLEL